MGVYLGSPLGLSYSHNFTTVDQLDLVVAVDDLSGWSHYRCYFITDIGYLRSVVEPNVGGAICPFKVGGGIGLDTWFSNYGGYGGYAALAVRVFADLRWEVFFASVPHFNLFLDFAPGIGIWTGDYYGYSNSRVCFSYRAGLGLRYQF